MQGRDSAACQLPVLQVVIEALRFLVAGLLSRAHTGQEWRRKMYVRNAYLEPLVFSPWTEILLFI